MHASYIFSTLIVLAPPTIGLPFLIYSWAFAITLWAVVAVVVLSRRAQMGLGSASALSGARRDCA